MALESVEQPDLADVGGDHDLLPVVAELEPGPLAAGVVLPHEERCKGTLQRSKSTIR